MQARSDLRKVGRYEILEVIGVGANSRVARAFDPLIARLVAIKLFPAELARGEARERFVQEARVVGQISHPSVIALHDMGIDAVNVTLMSETRDQLLPLLDHWAGHIRQLRG